MTEHRFISLLRLSLGFVIVSVLAVVTMIIAVFLLPWRTLRIKLCNYYGKTVGPIIIWLARARPELHHYERIAESKPAIYVSNHTSTLDAFVAIWLCPVGGCGVAKKEISHIPFFGWLYLLSGHLLIDRGDRGSAIAALQKTAALVLRHKLSVWIWPEGTRSRDGRLLPLKKGFAHLAIATGLPIVPIVTHDAHKNWAKHTFSFVSVKLRIDVLPAIPTTSWRIETIEEHLEEVHRAFADALNPDQKPLPA